MDILSSPSGKTSLEDAAFLELDGISLREILDQDSRPTFILDLDPDSVHDEKNVVRPVFCNAALRLHDKLLDSIIDAPEEYTDTKLNSATYDDFRNWVSGVSTINDSRDIFPLTLFYQGLLWTGSTVRQRWRFISGNALWQASDIPKGDLLSVPSQRPDAGKRRLNGATPQKAVTPEAAIPTNTLRPSVQQSEPTSITPSKNTSKYTTGSSSSVILAKPEYAVPDWTVPTPLGLMSEYLTFARNIDWANTPLGAMETWTSQFRELANLVMRNPSPCALFWGEELTMLYNEAYAAEAAGNKHPALMGTGFSGPFAETWEAIGPIFRECARTGNSIRRENDAVAIERNGYLEETFFSWSFIPVFGGTDRILGFFNTPFETTYQTLSARRLQMLRYLDECLSATKTVKQFWRRLLEGLEQSHFDVPFALLYSIVDSDDADTASHSSDSTISLKSCHLEGSIGIPKGHPASPQRLDLKRSQEGFVPAFREAMRTREPTTLQTKDGTLPESLLEGIDWRGHGDPCNRAIIFPVRPTNGENVFAFLLVGVNPRRAYDEDYKAFATMLNRQLATSLASVLLFEDEVRRSRRAAETAQLQREQLTRELEVQTSRMRRMTEHSPLGMYLYNPEGVLIEANEKFFEITGAPKDGDDELGFLGLVTEESKTLALDMWNEMMSTLKPSTRPLQLKSPVVQPRDLNGEPIECWVMAYSQPDLNPGGELVSVMGSITDISHMKWAQGLQERRLREAEETKRQQNEFIDITSHEMRNPLSAILICSDDIRDTLTQHQFSSNDQQVITDCIEAANNIALCVQHQKSIVDDILTVSKLDSNLLLITPIPAQPVEVVQRAMSMFKPEVQAKDIQFKFCPDESLQRLGIDQILLDPSRLLQITVNLITNAIKFTQASPERSISVHISASTDKPDFSAQGFKFVPTRSTLIVTAGEDWSTSELLYLRVEVQDTGCGLTVEEKELLFERFAQASPRTHAHYGGSGLGLFISRQLAELHGGQIGVSSQAGVGSTFGFFIQCKKIPSTSRPGLSRRTTGQSDMVKSPRKSVTVVSDLKKPKVAKPKSMELERLHVLIVEDNIVNQKVLSKQLIKCGFIVSTADNGIFALEHLQKTEFYTQGGMPLSVILMDLEMPEMDGLTCCKRIREMEAEGTLNSHVPIIAVTANVRVEQIATAKESGMDDVVSKPFRVPELLAKIKSLLEQMAAQ
ncbi:aerobic respiration control sensor protein arcB [Dothidotthia symphoricarpi CBS 119687]|uniref:Aerobic respiration control sensor protein arcB n=1 Tax=Dothidotthia symphoricarpi CBS 119687 TaxID=1392245 RepID=A0A6A6A4P6_9PLEO|nr:aerobic respiration control sensor protein arcB [Dothidotthia symphoricarpi CBS 119687]KAF2126869.1 aerobic respiration control sensor protein arcB [Dothidotthia symphoricarpi CBS 119687]